MALKDKLMTLEDFKAVRDVDVASNNQQFTDIKADLDTLEEALENVDGLSNDVKIALLACFDHVAWNGTGGQSYCDALENALYPSGLPSGYTRYDYITYDYSLGTRLVNTIVTDVAMSSDYILDTEFSFTNDGSGEAKNTECIMGSRLGNGGFKQFALFANRTTLKCGYWYDGTDSTENFNYSQGVNHVTVQPVGVSEIYPSNATIKINGTEYNTGATATGVTWSPWLGFFGYGEAANYTSSASNKFNLKLGRTIIKNLNRKTLYDFIPVHNGTNYGLYERINKKFYMGQEPSHFTCGNWS